MKTLWYREASRNNSLTLLSNPNGGSNASGANLMVGVLGQEERKDLGTRERFDNSFLQL